MVTYPSDWDVVELGSKCNITSSKRVFEREWEKSGIPFFRTRDIASFHSGEKQKDKLYISEETYQDKIASSGEPHKGDLLVTGVGTIGLPYLIDSDNPVYFKDGNILWIKKSEAFFPQWLYLQFLSKEIQGQIQDNSGFTTVGTFTIKNAKKLNVPMPSIKEQTVVAETLYTFDTYINDLAELIEKKCGIRDGTINDLLSATTRLAGFDKPWKETTLGKEYTIIMGQSPNSASYNASGIGVPLVQGNADIENRVTAPKRYTSMPTKICENGDTILAVRAPVGTASRANQRVCLGRGVCAINGMHKDFIYYLMRYYESAWEAIEQGSTFTAVSGKEVRNFEIKIPEEGEEQDAISQILIAMDEEIEALEIERDKMNQIREGAMDDLLTGRVRLKI